MVAGYCFFPGVIDTSFDEGQIYWMTLKKNKKTKYIEIINSRNCHQNDKVNQKRKTIKIIRFVTIDKGLFSQSSK